MPLAPEKIAHLRTDLLAFAQYMFKARKGAELVYNHHQKLICDALERVVIGKTKRLVINVPPRSGKTELAVINFMAWCMGNWPDCEFIHASYFKRLATTNTWAARAIVEHEAFAEIFGTPQLREDSNAKDEWRTETGGIVYATGADGTITGYGAGKMRKSFGGCFPYEQLVDTEFGPMRIGELVESAVPIKVWSYDEKTGESRLSRVTRFWTNPANHLIEISSQDGRSMRCTPDHEVLTEAGWVSAIHVAKALNLMDGQTAASGGLLPAQRSISGDRNLPVFSLWARVPARIRKILSDACPGLSELDLPDDSGVDAESVRENGSLFFAQEDLDYLIPVQDRAWSPFEHGESAVPESILHVLGLCAVGKIEQIVVRGVSVQMADFLSLGSGAYERLSDQMSDVAQGDGTVDGQVDPKVTLSVAARLKRSHGACPADLAAVGNFVQAKGAGYWKPNCVRYVGHVSRTYCLEVEGDNNFILSQNGAIVSNCIIIDDPHKAGEATSTIMRQNVLDWFSTTMESRKNSSHTPVVVIQQRLHEEDLAGWLLAGGNGEHWEHVCIPAITEAGESFWPGQFELDNLRRMELANPYVFAGQYLQRPAPIGGGMFKDAWWQMYIDLPEFEYTAIYGDTAQKTGEKNDYSVFQLWGKSVQGKAYLIDQIRGKWEAPELLMHARAFWHKHRGPHMRAFKIEDKVSGTGLIQTLRREGCPVQAIQRDRDKVTRAMDAAPSIQAGNVYLPSAAPYLADFMAESSVFPEGAHDDQLDPMMDAVQDMLLGGMPSAGLLVPRRLLDRRVTAA